MNKSIVIIALFIITTDLLGYEKPVHMDLSQISVEGSILQDNDSLRTIGLPGVPIEAELEFDDKGEAQSINFFPNSSGKPNTIIQLFRFGADFEDDLPTLRSGKHFYDPQNSGNGLNGIIVVPPILLPRPLFFKSSPEWILEDTGNILAQSFSFADARERFYSALTAETRAERNVGFGQTFQILGQVIHHLQDMGQPQHVRNDWHLPGSNDLYEGYVLETYDKDGKEKPKSLQGLVTDGNYNAGQSVILPRARDYWDWKDKTSDRGVDRIGMAEFTSTNFVSWNTNFKGDTNTIEHDFDYPLPDPGTVTTTAQDISTVTDCDVSPSLSGNITWIETPLTDGYTNTGGINSKASTLSLFNSDLDRYNSYSTGRFGVKEGAYNLNRCNFEERLKHVIPRAVAYSSGMIDYFFRGRMEITPPETGVFGLIDLNTPHSLSANGETEDDNGQSFGYKTITLNLKNTTPDIVLPDHFDLPGTPEKENEYPQDMFEGNLVAVIKYQPNYCYEFDGSGGFDKSQNLQFESINNAQTVSGCSASRYFTNQEGLESAEIADAIRLRMHERIVKSVPIPVGPGQALEEIPKQAAVELVFDFSQDPVPVNARDVYLQLVYRGKLGPDTATDPTLIENDAVVVATRDIAEPTEILIANSDDAFWLSDGHDWITAGLATGSNNRLPDILQISTDATYLSPGKYSASISATTDEPTLGHVIGTLEVDVKVTSPYVLQFSDSADSSSTSPMKDAVVHGEIFASLLPSTDVTSVAFYLDGAETPVAVVDNAPFDLGGFTEGINPYDTTSIPDGEHTIISRVSQLSGKTLQFETTFVVHNNPVNHAPAIGPVVDDEIYLVADPDSGSPSVFNFNASDPDGDPVKLELEFPTKIDNVGSLSFVDNGDGTAVLTGKLPKKNSPEEPVSVSYIYPSYLVLTLTASDGELTDRKEFKLTIKDVNEPHAIFTPDSLTLNLSTGETGTGVVNLGHAEGLADIDYTIEISSSNSQNGSLHLGSGEGFHSVSDLRAELQSEWNAAGFKQDNLSQDDWLFKLANIGYLGWPVNEIVDGETGQGPATLTPHYLGPLGPSDTTDITFTSSKDDVATSLQIEQTDLALSHHIRIGYLGSGNYQYTAAGSPDFNGQREQVSPPTGCRWTGGAQEQWVVGQGQYFVSDRVYPISSTLYGRADSASSLACRLQHQTVGSVQLVDDDDIYQSFLPVFGNLSGLDREQLDALQ